MTKIQKIKQNLIMLTVLLALISCYIISLAEKSNQYSANFMLMQIVFLVIGAVVCIAFSKCSIAFIRRNIWYFYGGVLLFLLILLIPNPLAPVLNGARRWYRFAGFSLQPSEIFKSFFILLLAHIAIKYEKQSWKQKGIMLLAGIPILLLIFKQPDLGTTIVYGITAFVILLFTIKSATWIIGLIIGMLSSVFLFGYVLLKHVVWLEKVGLHPYQFRRIYAWLDPENNPNDAYQVNLSLKSIGSGTLSGNHASGTTMYIPESHTDMVFSTIGNQFGFIGVSLLLCIFMLFLLQIVSAAMQMKRPFSMLVLTGFATMYAFNIFENIAMVIGLMPLTGIPLPFISYGGSSVLGNMIALGIMFAVINEDSLASEI